MFLRLATTHRPATDLGYLLAKNPARAQSFSLSFGTAHVFYPEVGDERCAAALFVDIDPVRLSRRTDDLEVPYVNDRPYVANSFLSVAIAEVFTSALQGRSRERQALAEQAIPLTADVPALVARGGEGVIRRLFEPLGYTVLTTPIPLDPQLGYHQPRARSLSLTGTTRLVDLLSHLYVLLPVLDDDKHYWVGSDEVDKLLDHGEGWLAGHPERDEIVHRYLRRQRSLAAAALARLVPGAENPGDPAADDEKQGDEDALEQKVTLNQARLDAVLAALHAAQARRVLDVGCGEGRLLRELNKDPSFTAIAGMDVSARALELAARRLKLEQMPERKRARIRLFHGSLGYRDERLSGYDALCAVEVIEHLEPTRLPAFERVLFADARPRLVLITTPNADYNVRFASLPAGKFRHADHRFEWTRAQFAAWAQGVAERHGYTVSLVAIGPDDAEVGAPTQMAAFTLGRGAP